MEKKKIYIIVGVVIAVITSIIIVLSVSKKSPTYEIIFETENGTKVKSQIIKEGEKIIKPEDPKKEGYIFVEWIVDGKPFDFSKEITSDIKLEAKWIKATKETITVKFNSDGGTTISNQIIEKGDKVIKPENPKKEGYIFKGWTLNDEDYDFDKDVEEDIEIKAIWEKEGIKENNTSNNTNKEPTKNNNGSTTTKPTTPPTPTPTTPTVKKYTVKFNTDGGSSVSSQTVNEGNKVNKPNSPTKEGYTFAGWTLNGTDYNFDTKVTKDITLIAKWIKKEKKNYTVTFNSNGGSLVQSQTVLEGNKVTKPNNPEKDGYNFVRWTLNGNNYNFDNAVNGNITLVAEWVAKKYTVEVTKVDSQSPQRILTVKEDGNKIAVQEIQYENGIVLAYGSKLKADRADIEGINNLVLVLTSGKKVTASVIRNDY